MLWDSGAFSILAAAGKQAAQDPASNTMFWVWTAGMVLLMYFIVLRPGQKQEKKRRELLSTLKKNDRVVTAAGIFGTVVSVEEDRVVLRVDDDRNVRMTFRKAGVTEILDRTEGEKTPAGASSSAT